MKKIRMFSLGTIVFVLIVSCRTTEEDGIVELVKPRLTMNIDYVCGCDDVTYVNPSAAEFHQIYTYKECV